MFIDYTEEGTFLYNTKKGLKIKVVKKVTKVEYQSLPDR